MVSLSGVQLFQNAMDSIEAGGALRRTLWGSLKVLAIDRMIFGWVLSLPIL